MGGRSGEKRHGAPAAMRAWVHPALFFHTSPPALITLLDSSRDPYATMQPQASLPLTPWSVGVVTSCRKSGMLRRGGQKKPAMQGKPKGGSMERKPEG